MKKLITFCAVALALVGCGEQEQSNQPKTLVEGYWFCLDRQSWDMLNDALVTSDSKMIGFLESSQYCGVLKGGLEYTIIDRSFGGTATVRVWSGDQYFDIYTNNEATR